MSYITGAFIKELRERQKLTQKELADRIMVSDKTVSKWETGKGLPDIGILDELAEALGISAAELLTGEYCENRNKAANMKKTKFYVCPICGNVVTSVGAGSFSCCGVKLFEQEPSDEADPQHTLQIETIDGDWFVSVDHGMSKSHYISFFAYVTADTVEVKKLYPEQNGAAQFRKKGHGFILGCCNKHGLFRVRV